MVDEVKQRCTSFSYVAKKKRLNSLFAVFFFSSASCDNVMNRYVSCVLN
jgi:hypothetical protein